MDGISIRIFAGSSAETSSVEATGTLKHIITDNERKTFNIEDSSLKKAVEAHYGKKPNDAYVKSPTPWDDLYNTYGWPQVQTVLSAIEAKVLEVTMEPVIIATSTFTNNSSKTGIFQVGVQDTVTNTVESSWTATVGVEVSQSISYEVGFLGSGGGGETSISFNAEYGQSKSESEQVTVGSQSSVSVQLEPNQSVIAQLSASRGKMKVQITYKSSLTGDTAVNYNPTYKGHHFYGMGINGVMEDGGLTTSYNSTEIIEIGYYANSQITLVNP